MNKEKEEYSSLRQEIITLCSASDTIIHILYVFLAPYLCFALTREDTIYILLSHIVILPLYLLAIDRRMATCRISAYISVFHEEEGNKWETRQMKYKPQKELILFKYFSAKHFPFIFANFVVLLVFIYQTSWNFSMSIYEVLKIVFEITLFIAIILIFIKYKKILVDDYVSEWKDIKEKEVKEKEQIATFEIQSDRTHNQT